MASMSGTLYIGVTNNIYTRVKQHQARTVKGFTKKYGCTQFIYLEDYAYIQEAIKR